jgi:hypothetical protein
MSTITNRRDIHEPRKILETITITPCIHDVAIDANLAFDRALAAKEEAA